MADPIRIADGLTWNRPAHAVYVKYDWGGDWQLVRGLYCDSVTFAAAPTVPQAQLTWTYGKVMAPGGTAPEVAERLRIERYYVKIVFEQVGPNVQAPFPGDGSNNYTWHGQVEEVSDERGGTVVRPIYNRRGTRIIGQRQIPTGKQHFGCLGFEMVLKAAPIKRSIVRAANGAIREIQRAITFNDPKIGPSGEAVPQPNRSSVPGPKGVYVFADVGAAATYWTTQSIIEYLLVYAQPETIIRGFVDMLPFRLHSDSGQAWPISVAPSQLDRPVLDVDGRSLYEAISALCDRRRLLGWSIDGVDPINKVNGRDVVLLRAWRFNDEAIRLHQGTIPGNPRQKSLEGFDQAAGAVRAKVRRSFSETYRRVVARGGRNRAVFTLSHQDGTLTTGWTSALAAEYRNAMSGSAGYDTLDLEQQQKANQRFRNRDRLGGVYCRFALAQTFTGRVGNGLGGPKQPYFPGGKPDEPLLHYWPGIRFLRRLPMKPDIDSGSLEDDCPLLAMVKSEDGKWDYADRAASTIEFSDHPIGRRWSLICVPAPNAPAVELRISGAPQHVLAKNDFEPLDADEPGDIDWRQQMLVTVAIEVDQWCEGVYEAGAGDVETAGEIITAFDALRVLVIELGPIARRDWIAYDTVIGLDAKGDLQRQRPGKWLRDDQKMVEDIAKIAGYWYTRARKACGFTFDGIFGGLEVGDLLDSIGGELVVRDPDDGEFEVLTGETTTLDAAVTQVTWDLVAMKTEIQTDYAELDLTDLGESMGLRK